MPIYAYRCADCGFQKDVLQKLSDAALTVCPTCGAASFSKQLSAPAFQLKGTGWYVTDFRDNGKTAEKDGPAAEKEGDGAKGGDAAKSEPGAADASKPAGDGPSAGGPAGDRTAGDRTAGTAAPKPDAKPTPAAAPVKPAAAAPAAPKPTSGAGPGGG